jgi:hypothetical protein
MPKDPTKNVDRYKIRGGHLNAFEFHQNQGAVSQQQHESGGQMNGPEDETGLPPDKAKAERIKKLLAEHGEGLAESMAQPGQDQPEGDNMKSELNADTRKEDDERDEDFAPTHGRSPEVIREMMQSRRATDEVPDPEDIATGNQKNSPQKKEHGITGARTGARKATVRRSGSQSSRSSSQAASQKGSKQNSEPAKGTRSTGDAAGAGGKQAALRGSTNRTIKSTTAKAGGKPRPSRKSAAQSATQKNEKPASKRASSQSDNKQGVKRATSQSGGKQNEKRTTGKQSAARNTANQKSASSSKTANGKTSRTTNKTGRTAAAKTRSSAKTQAKGSGGRSR